MIRILFIFLIFASGVFISANQNPYFDSGQRYQLKLFAKNKKDRSFISNFLHLDSIDGKYVYSTVNQYDFKQAQKYLSKYIVSTTTLNLTKFFPPIDFGHEYPSGDERFHTYKEVVKELNQIGKNFSNITTRFSLGTTVTGRDIPGIRIASKKSLKENKQLPGIFFVGAHHAREHLSVEIPMMMIKMLVENYSKDPKIKQLIDTRDIYFVPMLNADGAMYDIEGRQYKFWRKNRSLNSKGSFGVDLNRNYPFGWGTGGSSKSEGSDIFMGPKPLSEPETIAVKNFIDSHKNINILLSFHTFSELILYPWGGKNSEVGGRDQKVFETMAQTMAKWNNYKPMKASDLYVASGDTCDWAYGDYGIFCFTFELSPSRSAGQKGFYPGAGIIDKVYNANIKPILYLIEKAGNPYEVIK
ncbi:MAG: zinc carboxypeptidase [Bdellovibrionales bacterium]|nr:zinc carboxypeptidase [Bdellovibrionales bacterium]